MAEMQNDLRLGIALPCTDSAFPSQFVDSFFAMKKPPNSVYIRPTTNGPIDTVRNEIVELATIYECSHLIMMDTDQVYPPDTIERLMSHGLDFVTGKVHRRAPPYDAILLRGSIGNYQQVPDEEWAQGGLIEIDATGFGCVLMKMDVFSKLEKPFFAFDLYGQKEPVGEDVYFWNRARQAGLKVFCDADCKIGHIGSFVIVEESYWAYKTKNLYGI